MLKKSFKSKLILSYLLLALFSFFIFAFISAVPALIIVLLFALILGYLTTMIILKPVNTMAKVLERFCGGDFTGKVYLNSQDEIGQLASVLNKMGKDVESRISQLKIQNQRLDLIFKSMIEGVILVDNGANILSINPAVENIFNVSKDNAQGRQFLEVIKNDSLFEIVSNALNKGQFISEELNLAWPVHRIFKINASPIITKDTVNGCLLVIHDITEIRTLEKMKSDFVANVSHELKTPITSIKGFVETLLEGALDDRENAIQFLRIIEDHADRLNRLINDLLELSRIESRQVQLNIEKVNLKSLAEEALSGFRAHIKKKSIDVQNEISQDIYVSVDRYMIEQVLTNFIDNAIKFNKDKGFIKIYAQDTGANIKCTVEDSGMGIPEKDLSRIFERFYRVDKARSRKLGGTGLGLSIVKHIIDLHGTAVGAESVEGLGCRFWFILPK